MVGNLPNTHKDTAQNNGSLKVGPTKHARLQPYTNSTTHPCA